MVWLNTEASKYATSKHRYGKFRSDLRRLGKLKLEMMKINGNILEFKDIFDENLYYDFIEAVQVIGNMDQDSSYLKTTASENVWTYKTCSANLHGGNRFKKRR